MSEVVAPASGAADEEGGLWRTVSCWLDRYVQGRVKVGKGRGPSLSVPQSLSHAQALPLSLFSLQISISPGAMALPVHTPLGTFTLIDVSKKSFLLIPFYIMRFNGLKFLLFKVIFLKLMAAYCRFARLQVRVHGRFLLLGDDEESSYLAADAGGLWNECHQASFWSLWLLPAPPQSQVSRF